MAASHTETEAFTLIRTKLQRPRLPRDLIPRPRLLDRLHAGSERKLTLISAMAGTGKTTLLAQWLEEYPQPSAWLSLDEHDNNRIVFLTYLCSAIRTVFPHACERVLDFTSALQPPPARVIIATIVNELDELFASPPQEDARFTSGLVLALDDYHHITDPAIDEILASLIEHLPQRVHVALATRTDPRLPLAGWRARREMTEVRSADLRFTSEEASTFLEGTIGRELSPEIIRLLEAKTEGWVVGLRLAALSMRTRPDDKAFVQGFKGTSSDLIVEYLVSEVLARQSAEIQDFALRTSILDRFCAPLCEALTKVSATKGQEYIEWVAQANLFLVPLDEEGGWYRYHHLFRDLLRHELSQQCSATDIAGLHARAGAWFAQNELVDEALHHFLAADDTAAAVGLVARHRHALINRAQWARLDQFLGRFSPDILDQYPDLLMLRAWLFYHRGRWVELPAALQRVEAALHQDSLPPEEASHLQGEISALRSLQYYHAVDPESTVAHAQQALEMTPREAWAVRVLARLHLAGVWQMRGDSTQTYATIYRAYEEEETQSDAFKAVLLLTVCLARWIDADLQGMAQAANQCIRLSQRSNTPQIRNYGHYNLGSVHYQQNDLAVAEQLFTTAVQQPYLNYGDCYSHSACGLALTLQAQGRPDPARAVTESALAFLLETGNTTFMPLIQSLQAEIALRQGRIATAGQWAAHLDPIPPFTPVWGFFSPHLTLVRVWLAQDTSASRRQAADLVGEFRRFVEATHNTRFLIEALALQALLRDVEGDEPAALAALEQAIALAEPGGFIRLFVDLGPPLDRLLDRLRWQGGAKGPFAVEYITLILTAFETTRQGTGDDGRPTTKAKLGPSSVVRGPSSPLIEPLTPRELEVLTLLGQHLTNNEIAEDLVVSPSTVKTHTLNIYRKLEVNSRRQAVDRARELSIL
jgi:LuxR family maltose regulon positive regulatory protein